MTAPRKLPVPLLALVVLLVSACGAVPGTAQPAPAPSTSASADPSTTSSQPDDAPAVDDEEAVEDTFERYSDATVDRDFATACELNSPESIETLLDNAKSQDLPAGTCEEALTAIYQVRGVGEASDEIARTTDVRDVTVTGDKAKIKWSAEAGGKKTTVTTNMRRIDGEWKIVDQS